MNFKIVHISVAAYKILSEITVELHFYTAQVLCVITPFCLSTVEQWRSFSQQQPF